METAAHTQAASHAVPLEPAGFWLACADAYDRRVGPIVDQLESQAASLGRLRAALDALASLLAAPAPKDPAGLHGFAQSLERAIGKVNEVGRGLVAPRPGAAPQQPLVPGEAQLRQLLEETSRQFGPGLQQTASQLLEEFSRWGDAHARSKRERAQKERELAEAATGLMSRMKETSTAALTRAAEEVRALEAQAEAATSVPHRNAARDANQASGASWALSAAGLAALAGGLWFSLSTPAAGLGVAGLGVVLFGLGIKGLLSAKSASAAATGASIPEAPQTLRTRIKQVTESAEKQVALDIAPLKDQLKQLRLSIDELPANEQAASLDADRSAKQAFEGLCANSFDRASKVIQVLHQLCDKWAQRAAAAREGALEEWKTGVKAQVDALNALANAPEPVATTVGATVLLGRTQHDVPERLRAHLGPLSIHLPFRLSFDGPLVAVRASAASHQPLTSAVCTRLVLELVAAAQGRVSTRLWDPGHLGAGYSRLLELTHSKQTFVDQGRALTSSRDLDEALSGLQKLVADRLAFMAQRRAASWLELAGTGPAADQDLMVFLAVGFPAGFGETNLVTLRSIAATGAKCGVFVILDLAHGESLDAGLREQVRREAKSLLSDARVFETDSERRLLKGSTAIEVQVDEQELFERARRLLEATAAASSPDSGEALGDLRFADFRRLVAPERSWSQLSADGVEVHLGLGLRDESPQTMRFDTKTPHALLLGGTGSGKSNLLQSLIQGVALNYSPLEVTFYLADLKDGVEFARYTQPRRLPHAAAIAATADPRYAVALVKAAAEELTRRNKLFIAADCTTFEGYRARPRVSLPRILLIIDEFQVLFEDRDSAIAVKAALVNLCKKGRSAGIHVLLASQSLKGKAGDIDEVLGLIHSRILMKISESDARRAVSDSAMAARAAATCTRRGLGCIDSDFGAGVERYFRNPFVNDNDYFFGAMAESASRDGSAVVLDEAAVVWRDEPRQLLENPRFAQLESGSREILVGEPYAVAHAAGFHFSREGVDGVAVAGGTAAQQFSVLSSILRTAAVSCSPAIRVIAIRNSDSALQRAEIERLAAGTPDDLKIFEAPEIRQALDMARAACLDVAPEGGEAMHVLLVLGAADLSAPKRLAMAGSSADKAAGISDVEVIGELLQLQAGGRLQIIVACKTPMSFMESLSAIRDRLSIKIFGPATAGNRLRDFVGLPDVPELKPGDMALIRSSDGGVTPFKPFVAPPRGAP